jgi:hypothetical protein
MRMQEGLPPIRRQGLRIGVLKVTLGKGLPVSSTVIVRVSRAPRRDKGPGRGLDDRSAVRRPFDRRCHCHCVVCDGGEVAAERAKTVIRQSVVCLFGDSLAVGGLGALGLSDDRCARCVSVNLGQYRRRGRPDPACFRHEGVCRFQGRGATIRRRVRYWVDILGGRAKERRDKIAVKPSAADHPNRNDHATSSLPTNTTSVAPSTTSSPYRKCAEAAVTFDGRRLTGAALSVFIGACMKNSR